MTENEIRLTIGLVVCGAALFCAVYTLPRGCMSDTGGSNE